MTRGGFVTVAHWGALVRWAGGRLEGEGRGDRIRGIHLVDWIR